MEGMLMLVGHFAAAMAARVVAPRAPLWVYFMGSQLVDVVWAGLVAVGVEKARIDVSLPGTPFDFHHMPWTHSLPGAIAWSLGGAVLLARVCRLDMRTATVLGSVIFSHWLLDFIVHRPDLLLWVGGPKVGLGLWNLPAVEQTLEIGLLALGASLLASHRARDHLSGWPIICLLGFLVVFQAVSMLVPIEGGALQMGLSALVTYAVLIFAAAITERQLSLPRLPRLHVRTIAH